MRASRCGSMAAGVLEKELLSPALVTAGNPRGTLGAALAILLFSTLAQASGLRISPVRLDLSSGQPAAQVELSNLTGEAVAVQVRAYRWQQDQGEDKYEPTKDIFFAPPIVTIPAKGRTSVRFRLRAGAPGAVEGAYRVYFQELPPANPAATASSGANFRIRFGVPLFVLASAPVAPELKVQASPESGLLKVVLENAGKAHIKIEGMELYPAGVDREKPATPVASALQSTKGTSYLLPGTRHDWELTLPAGFDPSGHVLLVRTDEYSGRAGSGLNKRGWLWQPLVGAGPGAAASKH